jgi:anti-sigma regulatory factor (Ser/Thr protein kinase)
MDIFTSRSQSRLRSIILACGVLAAALGLTVLTGWYTHNLTLLQIHPSFVAMAYNTALCFTLSGAALGAFALGRRRIALACGAFLALIGGLTLSEYLFNVSLGIDELLMRSYVRSGILHYGRMAVATAACFTTLGLAQIFYNLREGARRPAFLGIAGAVVLSLGAVALTGYFIGVTGAYRWGQLTRMAVHTSAGFLVLGLGSLAGAWLAEQRRGVSRPRWLPLCATIFGMAASVSLWQALVVDQSGNLAIIHQYSEAHPRLVQYVQTQSMLPYWALAGGLSMAALLGWTVFLTQKSSERAELLRVAGEELEQRVEERTDELARANQALQEVLTCVSNGRLKLCHTEEGLPASRRIVSGSVELSQSSGLKALRDLARNAAVEASLPIERIDDLVTAVSEASMNAVVHGGGGHGEVRLSKDDRIQVWVRDFGSGITLDHLPRATLERGYTTAGTLGHGFWLMLSTVDHLFLMTGPTGTTVVLEQGKEAPLPPWLIEQMNGDVTALAA